MSKRLSLISAFVCCLIWGTTFIAQDTGMDEIGPFTFNGVRFFVGFQLQAAVSISLGHEVSGAVISEKQSFREKYLAAFEQLLLLPAWLVPAEFVNKIGKGKFGK